MARDDFTEYGGGPGRGDRTENGMPRRLSVAERASDMRRVGLRDELISAYGDQLSQIAPYEPGELMG
jgi:hypothetical protein